ncbi:MAG: aminotransferase class III-fold pyridoxal phosphate-dependent enzyme [Thiothrix sp.]|nr:aminotransferase class III-fold pyridoxal phosphate-dependent enzyme [Thiothrix sp.]HPQ94685.1 aminotransferase class III-fold pyridoxal phosphate-dependent enzyme [Thiolinea sp.]
MRATQTFKHLAEHDQPFWHPMAHPAEMRAHPSKIFVSAEGVEITDIHGHTVLDAVGGLWNVNLGYSCEPVKKAIADQLQQLPYYSSFRGTTTAPVVELGQVLQEWFAPDGLSRSFFTSGGSDSVETCLRLARQYHKVRGDRDRYKFIGLKKGYHGTHFGGASVNGNANFRRNYEPLLPGTYHIPAPWAYRNPFDTSDPETVARLCARLLEEEIQFQGPDTVAAFIMEPVLGAGGVIVPHASFMPQVREICDRYGVLLIADEVITAFGRTGAWTGSRLWGVKPDLISTAKAISNAYFPMGAVMISDKVVEAFENSKDGFGAIGHGYTYSGHPVGCAAALATLAETRRLNIVDNAAARGAELQAGLQALQQQYERVGDARGIGLMGCLELVADRASKQPTDKGTMEKVAETAYQNGVIVRTSGNNLIISPPLIITAQDVKRILTALDAGLAAAG